MVQSKLPLQAIRPVERRPADPQGRDELPPRHREDFPVSPLGELAGGLQVVAAEPGADSIIVVNDIQRSLVQTAVRTDVQDFFNVVFLAA